MGCQFQKFGKSVSPAYSMTLHDDNAAPVSRANRQVKSNVKEVKQNVKSFDTFDI